MRNSNWSDEFTDTGVNGRILLKRILHEHNMMTYVDWVLLVQDREYWRDLLDTVMTLWIPQKAVIFLIRWVTISF
jgi:hypothetical protein